jgi:hypothetical protein
MKKAHIAVNLCFADWTGLEQAGIHTSNTMSCRGGDWVVTELRPGERAGVKIPICRFACAFISYLLRDLRGLYTAIRYTLERVWSHGIVKQLLGS